MSDPTPTQPEEQANTPEAPGEPTPLWIVGLVVFGIAGIGFPLLFVLIVWLF